MHTADKPGRNQRLSCPDATGARQEDQIDRGRATVAGRHEIWQRRCAIAFHRYTPLFQAPSKVQLLTSHPPGAIFRASAGMMRNDFYPTSKAEYMTRERFQELGLTMADIGMRDTAFGVIRTFDDDIKDAVEHVARDTYKQGMMLGDNGNAVLGIEAPAADPDNFVPAMEVEQLPVCFPLSLCVFVRYLELVYS